MKKSSIQLMARITAGLGFFGSAIIVINLLIGMYLSLQGATLLDIMHAATLGNLIVAFIGTATFILGIILLVQFNRLGKSNSSGIMLIVAGIFAWLFTYVALVLWIIAGIFLLRMKFEDETAES